MELVTGVRSSSDGESVKSYTSHSMGVSFRLSAQLPPKETKRTSPDVTVSFNVSDVASRDTEIGSGQKCEAFPLISQEHCEPLEYGRARFMLAMASASPSEKDNPSVYIVRYEFNPPQAK